MQSVEGTWETILNAHRSQNGSPCYEPILKIRSLLRHPMKELSSHPRLACICCNIKMGSPKTFLSFIIGSEDHGVNAVLHFNQENPSTSHTAKSVKILQIHSRYKAIQGRLSHCLQPHVRARPLISRCGKYYYIIKNLALTFPECQDSQRPCRQHCEKEQRA